MFSPHTFKNYKLEKMKYLFSQVQLQILPYGLNTHFELNPCALSLSTSLEDSK